MSATSRTHYEVLGVEPTATEQDLKAAYRKLAKSLHPDMATGSAALFGVVSEAYEVLSKPDSRAAYDRDLTGAAGRTGSTGGGAGPQPEPERPPRRESASGAGSAGAGGPVQDGPFSRAYTAAAAGQPHTSPWNVRPGTSRPGASRAAATGPVPRGRGGSIAWWALPLVLAVTFGAGLLRFTGITATVLGVRPGDPVMFGNVYNGVPTLADVGGEGALNVAIMCVLLTAGFWWRKQHAPTARVEKVLLLIGLGVLAGLGEFLLVSAQSWMLFLGLMVAYAGWVWSLKQLPGPGRTEQWESFSLWMKGVREHQERKRAAARRERRDQLQRLRAQMSRVLHWK